MAFSRLAEPFPLSGFAYAHRGLWAPDGPSENGLPSFQAAARAGLGIELDVRQSRDCVAMIFHDSDLERMIGCQARLDSLDAAELNQMKLPDGSNLPGLAELLEIWPEHLPILCEIKIDPDQDYKRFAKILGAQLEAFGGTVAAMSFHAPTIEALPDRLIRGLVIRPSQETGLTAFQTRVDTLTNVPCDFLSCNEKDTENPTLQAMRKTHPLIPWTVRDPRRCAELIRLTDGQIFEGFAAEQALSLIQETKING